MYPNSLCSPRRHVWWAPLLLLALLFTVAGGAQSAVRNGSRALALVAPRQQGEQVHAELVEASGLIRAEQARTAFGVDGSGLTVAVLDTGIRTTHRDFTDRVTVQLNFTSENNNNPGDASDAHGQGTHLSGIIAANGPDTGIAPGADVAALKVLDSNANGEIATLIAGLDWVIANHTAHHISVVNLSYNDGGNYTTKAADTLAARLATLRDLGIAVCSPAGDAFYFHACHQGMGYPAIFPQTISVGAVYDADLGAVEYPDGALAMSTAADRICPFSQRLHSSVSATNRTDVFAPGADLTSAGITSDTSSATAHGTRQAAAAVAGVVLLLQDYYLRTTDTLPTVDQLERWLRAGAVSLVDGNDEDDNVTNTQLIFPRVDALAALQAAEQELNSGFQISGKVLADGVGVAGATVTVGVRTASTGADGGYTVTGLAAGSYTVRPTKTDYVFDPLTRSVTVGPNQANVDFTATKTSFTIRGTVRTANGFPMGSVSILAGDRSTSTDASGAYALTGLAAGTYELSAVTSGYTFTPSSQNIVVGPDQSGIDFTGLPIQTPTYAISGTVRLNGSGLSGVTVSGGGKTTVTSASGTYALTGLEPGSYTVTASRSGYTLSPASRQISLISNASGVDFTATVQTGSISGFVTFQGTGIPGVTVSAGARTTATDGAGHYVFPSLSAGTYTITPQASGYTFNPTSATLTVGTEPLTADFAAIAAGYRIGGRVTRNGVGLSGITLQVGNQTVTTDAAGNYTAGDLVAGTYVVQPTSSGYQFSPAARTLTVGPNRTDANFSAVTVLQIRGRVTQGEAGVSGMTIAAGGRSTTTEADGGYVLANVPSGNYTVTASGAGLSFTPPFRTVTLDDADAVGVDFSVVTVPHLVSVTPKVTELKSGKSTTVTVQFDRPVTANVDVLLSSSNPAGKVPAKVRLARGRSSAKFTLKARTVATDTPAVVTASSGGYVQQATVTILAKTPRR